MVRRLTQRRVQLIQHFMRLLQVGRTWLANAGDGRRGRGGAKAGQGLIPTLGHATLICRGIGRQHTEDRNSRVAPIPLWRNTPNPLIQWRMGRQHALQRAADAGGEIHMAELGRMSGAQLRTVLVATDFLQRPGNALRIAGELHGRGVGEKLALPAYCGLAQAAEERPGIAQQPQGCADRDDRCRRIVAAGTRTATGAAA